MKDFQNRDVDTSKGILHALSEERIFWIEPDVSGTFDIVECCDNHFAVEMTEDELRQLAAEIIALADRK